MTDIRAGDRWVLMRVEPIPSDDDPEAFAAWCREHDCRPTGSTRRAWCSRFGTYLRDAVAVGTTITGDQVLLYEADLAETPFRTANATPLPGFGPDDGPLVGGEMAGTRWRVRVVDEDGDADDPAIDGQDVQIIDLEYPGLDRYRLTMTLPGPRGSGRRRFRGIVRLDQSPTRVELVEPTDPPGGDR